MVFAIGCIQPAALPVDGGLEPCPDCPSEVDFTLQLGDALAPARRLPGRAFLRSSREVEPVAGMRNRDHSNYVRVEGGRAVLADETGPGVITRLWFTFGPEFTDGDHVRLHVFVDGREIAFVAGESGAELGVLTSGELLGLPGPWVLGRDQASGGFLVNVPIHYASSIRLEIDELPRVPETWMYYQVDGRSLPREVGVEPFDVVASEARDAALARATELWVEHDHPGDDLVEEIRELAPGATIERALIGPGVITTLEIDSLRAARDTLEVTIEVDGAEAARAPLGWLTGSAAPGLPYSSALSEATDASASFFAPIPFEGAARVVVRNAGSVPTNVGLRVRLVEGALDDDLGRFEARCSSRTIDVPASICEQDSAAEYPNVVVGGELRGRGQYIGQSFVMRAPEAWWWALECDHEVWIDGEYAMLGTGTEDYFGGAFYFMNGPFSSPTTGASGWVRDVMPSSDTHMFRWHLVDGIPYERELRFEYESYIDGTIWDGCVFAYQFE